jgi:hypothetical protein
MTEQTNISKITQPLSQEATEYFLSNEEIEEEQKIATEFGLNIDQTSILGAEIFRFVSGVYSEDQFKKNLKEHLGLTEEKILGLLSEVSVNVFTPIMDKIPGLSNRVKALNPHQAIIQSSSNSIEEVVSQICLQISSVMKNQSLMGRCREIVATRVREIRGINETRAMLERSVEKGGLGVTGEELEKFVKTIEQNVEVFRGSKRKIFDDEQKNQQIQKQQKEVEREQMRQKESQLFDKRYAAVTGKVPTESMSPSAPALSRATVATSIQHHLEQQASRIDTQKVKQAVEKIIPQAQTKTQNSKPFVQDVQFTRRLAGPSDELRSIDLERFRRLSQDPIQAVQRIKDMLDLLEEQGYEKFVQGLQSFRASPLFKQCTVVTQQALVTGKGIDAMLGNLKRGEYDALMKLNSEIRF